MFSDQSKFVTREEVENSYEFKLIKKIIKREYPWVIDVVPPNDEQINNYALIFCDVLFNPFMLQEETGWPFNSFMPFYFKEDNPFTKGSPNFYTTSYLTTIYDVDRTETNEISDGIETIMKQVAKSPAVPSDLKLNKDRTFVIGEWTMPKSKVPENILVSKKKPD